MGKVLSGGGWSSVTLGLTHNYLLPLGRLYEPTGETYGKITMRVGGVVSHLAGSSNAIGSTRGIRLRKNSTNAAQLLDFGSSSFATRYDAVNTDTYAAGDSFGVDYTNASGTPGYYWTSFVFDADGGLSIGFYATSSKEGTGTFYHGFQGSRMESTEANVQALMRSAGTVQNCTVLADNNVSSSSQTWRIRKNGANGNINITVPGSTSGVYEDLTNTDAFVSGDLLCWQSISSGSYSSANDPYAVATISYSGNQAEFFGGIGSEGASYAVNASDQFWAIVAGITTQVDPNNKSEALWKMQFGYDGQLSRLRIHLTSSTTSATQTVKLRKNGADGNNTIAITAGASGRFEDTTHTDTFAPTDDLCYVMRGGGSGSFFVNLAQITQLATSSTLAATNLTVGSPVLGTPAYAKAVINFVAVFTPHSPVFDTPAFNQKQKFTPAGLTVGRPFIQIPGLTGINPMGLGVGSPTFGAPILTHPWGLYEPIPTVSAQIIEAGDLLDLVLDGLIKAVPTRIGGGRPGWDFRRQIGIVRAYGKQMIFTGTLGEPLVACFNFATAANASFEGYERLRRLIVEQVPFSLPAQATAHLAVQCTLAQMAFITAATTYRSRDAALTALKRITEAYAPAEEDVADEADPMMYMALVAARAATVRDLAERGRQLPRVIEYKFATPMTGLWITHRLYDEATRFEDLRDENDWIHPAFCPEEGHYLSRHLG